MLEGQPQATLDVATADKLWSSTCQQAMAVDTAHTGQVVYRCAEPCGKHVADIDRVRAGLLWHYRGCSVSTTYGRPDEEIVGDMFTALQLAWIRDGSIYTARFH